MQSEDIQTVNETGRQEPVGQRPAVALGQEVKETKMQCPEDNTTWYGQERKKFNDQYSSVHIPDIGIMVRVFANGPGDLGSIPGRVISKTQKILLDVTLLNTQHYKVRNKGRVEQSRERSCAHPYTLV